MIFILNKALIVLGYYVNQCSRGAKNPVDLCDKSIGREDENAIVGDGFQ
jgi:hypothetical protein